MRRSGRRAFEALLFLFAVVTAASCSGGSSGAGPGDGTTVLAGRVTAADGQDVAGIRVEAEVDGAQVGSALLTADGRFEIPVGDGGEVRLVFDAGDVRVAVTVAVPSGSTAQVEVVVDFEGTPSADVTAIGVGAPPLRCDGGDVERIDDPALDLVVGGAGRDCLRATGGCALSIRARSVTLTGCERCIRAEGGASVDVETGAFLCEAFEDGIRAGGNASVSIFGATEIDISGDDHAIRASGTPSVTVASDGRCVLEGGQGALREDGNALVDTRGCRTLELDRLSRPSDPGR